MNIHTKARWPLCLLLAAGGVARAGLVAHYTFDELPGTTVAANQVPASTPGTIGNLITQGIPGVAGTAFSFPGTSSTQNDAVDMDNASFLSALTASGQLSFSAWVRTTDTTGNRNTVVFAGDNALEVSYTDMGVAAGQSGAVGAASARNRPNIAGGNAQATGIFSTPAVPPVNDGQWHHLVMTADLATARLQLWVDGVLANTQTMPLVGFPAFNNFEIGRLGRLTPTDPFTGDVDDVQVYDHALTAAQVNFLKNNPGRSYAPADTDADGLDDAWEMFYFGNLTSQSGNGVGPDNDGATNLEEQAAGTNPTVADTDGDGRTDGQEIHGPPVTDPLDPDSDDDGLTDGAEVNVHLTDPNNSDSDFDSLPDGWEVAHSLNPNSSAGADGDLGDPDGDGLDNFGEYHFGDNSTDPRHPDTDGDGYTDLQENRTGTWESIERTGTNPLNPDTDGDGLRDGRENPDVAYVPGVTPGTNPNIADTDGDGFRDGQEFGSGSNPTDPASIPPAAKGLLAHYKFDEPASATTAVSALGTSPGAVGTAVTTGVTGIAGNAYRFANDPTQAGIVDMGNATYLPEIISARAFTYTAWIKSTDTSSGRNTVISLANTLLDNSYIDSGIVGQAGSIGALSGRFRPNGNTNNAELFSHTAATGPLVNDDVWHHIALTLDLATSTLRLFVDGVQVAQNTTIVPTAFPDFNNLEIGRLGRKAPTDAFQGLVDDVQIYNEALSPERIAQLMAQPGISADEDHDRLDDAWEIRWFGSITAYNGSDDPDGDGLTNEQEETAGTPPIAEAPGGTVRITSSGFVTGGAYVIRFTGAPSTAYQITTSTDLTGFVPLSPAVTATTDAGGAGTATVPAAQATGGRRFFRVQTP